MSAPTPKWGGKNREDLTDEELLGFNRFGYRKQPLLTPAQRDHTLQLLAEGTSPAAIHRAHDYPLGQVRRLQESQSGIQAIANRRLHDVIPGRLAEMEGVQRDTLAVLKSLESRMSYLEDLGRRMVKAASRRKVELSSLTEGKVSMRKQIKELRNRLWRATGIKP